MIPPDPNSRPEQSTTTEAPTTGAEIATDGQPKPAASAETPGQGTPRASPNSDQQHRRRRRRRRHRPRIDSTTAALGEGSVAAEKSSAQQAGADALSITPTAPAAPTQQPTGNAPRKRRRRHRGPRSGKSGAVGATSDPMSARSGDAVPESAPIEPTEPRRGQEHRREGRRHRAPRDKQFDRQDRGKQPDDLRKGENRGARIGKPRDMRDARRGRDRDRNDSRKKPEPKIYRLEAIVDRGFEDVPDPTTEGATRRVDWTILKRTTADQRTARTLSAIYVVQRDGIDTEFPHLSAARAAVNKSINHPEKLTLSKADHAAAKGAKK
jgi:hypothetical protein